MHCYLGVTGSERRLSGEITSESSRRVIKEMNEGKVRKKSGLPGV